MKGVISLTSECEGGSDGERTKIVAKGIVRSAYTWKRRRGIVGVLDAYEQYGGKHGLGHESP